MNQKIKRILRNTCTSLGISALLFCLMGVAFDFVYKGSFHLENYRFSRFVLCSLVIGLGFGLPAFIYENDRLPLVMRSLIHMGTGCTVMLLASMAAGWLPVTLGTGVVISMVAEELTIALIIWFGFYLYHKRLVRRMNEKLSKRNR